MKTKKLKTDLDIWVCAKCGSEDVEEVAWVNMNTGEYGEGAIIDPDRFCGNCDKHCTVVTKKEYYETKV